MAYACSPSKRRHDTAFSPSLSPRQPRQRLQSTRLNTPGGPHSSILVYNEFSHLSDLNLSNPAAIFNNASQLFDFRPPSPEHHEELNTPVLTEEDQLRLQYLQMEMHTHDARLLAQEALAEGKGTEKAYPLHQLRYEKWWRMHQKQKKTDNQSWVEIPAQPITATKVAKFLEYDAKRPKVCCQSTLLIEPHNVPNS